MMEKLSGRGDSLEIMKKRHILDIAKDVYLLLKKENELSIRTIADRTNSRWETALRVLEFLKMIEVVSERKGLKTYRKERLFSLR
jgi:predicted transcriptional regulator